MIIRNFVLLLAGIGVCVAQRGCSRDRLRQCEERVRRNIQRRVTDMNRMDMAAHCEDVRDDFNCLLTETRCLTSETERNTNGDTIRNALKYLRDGCDTVGGGKSSWRDSSCFIGDNMKTCESSNPLSGTQYSSANPETCRRYNLLYECVADVVRSRCRREDERMLGQYLVDSAQDLAWNCGERTSTVRDDDRYGRDRDRDDRYSGSERDGYRRDDHNRDRYGTGSQYGRNNYYSGGGGGDVTCCRSERCDSSRRQQCRSSLSRVIDDRMAGYQDSQKCRRIRDDFNCLMWQTSNCVNRDDRDRDNDIFRRARDYISRNCDTYGRWTDNNCYKTTEMQRCEALLTNTRTGANYEACRSFLSFRDCMQDELERRCTREDDLFQGAYLVDKAQELSWQCGADTNGRNQYSTSDRNGERDRDFRNDRDRDRTYDRDRDGDRTYDRDGDRTYDRDRDNNGFGYGSSYNGPEHLGDEDANCAARITSYSDQCKKDMDDKNRDVYVQNDFEVKEKMKCCAIRQYRNCLFDVTRRYCQSERSRVVDSLMAGYRHRLTSDSCARIYDGDCNATIRQSHNLTLNGERDRDFRNDRDRDRTYDRDGDRTYDRDRDNNRFGYGSSYNLGDEDANCKARTTSYSDQCKKDMDDKKRDVHVQNDFEVKNKMKCCAIRQYRNCLFDVTRRYCQSERSRVVDSLMAGYRHRLTSDSCARIYDGDCNATIRHSHNLTLLVSCLALLSAIFALRR